MTYKNEIAPKVAHFVIWRVPGAECRLAKR